MQMLGFIHMERIRKDFVFASYSIQCHKKMSNIFRFSALFKFSKPDKLSVYDSSPHFFKAFFLNLHNAKVSFFINLTLSVFVPLFMNIFTKVKRWHVQRKEKQRLKDDNFVKCPNS